MDRLTVLAALATAWRIRMPMALSYLGFSLLLAAFLAPLLAVTLQLVVKLSGEPALSDFDIAMFLLTPLGLVALLFGAGLTLTLLVMNSAIMMGIAHGARDQKTRKIGADIVWVARRWPRILSFAVRLTLRILLIALPFVAIAGFIYLNWLTEFDINYYLSNRPPVFFGVIAGAGASLLIGALILLNKLIGWALALPLVVFTDMPPMASFAESRQRMTGYRLRLLRKLVVWGALSFLAYVVAGVLIAGSADIWINLFDFEIKGTLRSLVVFSALFLVANFLIATLSNGTLAILLMDYAGWPDPASAAEEQPPRGFGWALAAAGVICAVMAVAALDRVARNQVADSVEVIAHRGAAGARPENTMASVEKALEDRADWVEIDVQETADDAVLVIHDSDFMKIAGNPIKVWDATMQDVAEIDIGSWFDPAYADQRAPLLEDVLTASRDRSGVLIELKYYGHDIALEQRVSDIVDATGMADQVMAMSLKYDAVKKMKTLRPDWQVGLLSSASAGRIWQLEADFLAVNKASLTPRLVREMRNAGKKLYVWTVNEPIEMSRVISMGVDGVITDEPAMARDVLEHRRDFGVAERLVLAMASYVGIGLDDGKTYRDNSP